MYALFRAKVLAHTHFSNRERKIGRIENRDGEKMNEYLVMNY